MSIVQEIYGLDLKSYVVSSKSCKFNNGCILESRYGKVVFDFEKVENINYCVIRAKKNSGNGKITVTHNNGQVQKLIVVSSTNQKFNIDLSKSKKLEIKRDDLGTGEVQIFGIILNTTAVEKPPAPPKAWRSIIKRCGRYKGIALTGTKLLASEGACFFETQRIAHIQTNPADLCVKNNSGFTFRAPCEIIDIRLSDGANESVTSKELYPSFEGAPKNYNIALSQNKLFDSTEQNISNTKSHNVVVSPGSKNIKIDRDGFISIPVSGIESNKEYLVTLEGNKASGNGKIELCIMSDEVAVSSHVFIFNEMVRPHSHTISTKNSNNTSLRIKRPAGATGAVNVNKISVTSVVRMEATKRPIGATSTFNMGTFKEVEIIENDPVEAHGVYKMPKNEDIKFVVVIPSYNNAKWVKRNLNSVFTQQNQNYRVIFVDDCSSDNTFDVATELVKKQNKSDKITLIRNSERKGALHNLYDSIHSCDDNEIIITLDGDDWFAHEKVLDKLSNIYSNPDVWLTYGQYKSYPDNGKGCSAQIPGHITKHNMFRQFRWCSSHLRTFYSWLFKKIRKEDLLDQSGKFYPMTWDLAFQFPMLEMGGPHCVFIPDVLYIYNVANPINDSKVNLKLQQSLEREIRRKPKYNRV